MIGPGDVDAAAVRLVGRVRTTPIVTVEAEAFSSPAPIVLKLELLQHAGSLKVRGAFNRILSRGPRVTEVIAASGGNHGLGVTHAARALGIAAEIYVPETASPVKVARLHALGASVVQVGQVYADALVASEKRAAESAALVSMRTTRPR